MIFKKCWQNIVAVNKTAAVNVLDIEHLWNNNALDYTYHFHGHLYGTETVQVTPLRRTLASSH